MTQVITVETRKKVVLGGRTRITTSTAVVPEHLLLDVVRQTPIDAARDCYWPDGTLEAFYWTRGLALAGPSNSRLLPAIFRRDTGRWYVESDRVYWQNPATGRLESVEVKRG